MKKSYDSSGKENLFRSICNKKNKQTSGVQKHNKVVTRTGRTQKIKASDKNMW